MILFFSKEMEIIKMENNIYYNNYYNEISIEYNNIRLDEKRLMDYVINILNKHIKCENAKILDIGCGTGKYGELMKKNGYKVIGIDRSKNQIQQAKQLIEAYIANATKLPFEDNYFDSCTMIMMLQQLTKEDRIEAFKEVYRVLKKDGVLIIKTCSHEDLEKRHTDMFFPRVLEIDKIRYPKIDTLKDELLSVFQKIEIEKASILIEKSKQKYLERFKKRGTSNLSFLTDEELYDGIKKFEENYKEQDVIKTTQNNTFLIARKD